MLNFMRSTVYALCSRSNTPASASVTQQPHLSTEAEGLQLRLEQQT